MVFIENQRILSIIKRGGKIAQGYGIQMKWKDLTDTLIRISNFKKKTFVLHGLYKIISVLQGVTTW